MPNRIIKESICVSEHIDRLTPFEEVTFYRLLVNCDDYGCFDAREKVVSSRLFPLRDVKAADIRKTLSRLAAVGLIRLYAVDDKPYLIVNKWSEHQRVRVSRHKYPTPPEGCDNSPQLAAKCGNVPPESESESKSESESIVKVNRKRFTPPTVDEVRDYCRERNNNVDPEKFVAFYESKGWKVGNQAMKDWKACVITWEKRDRDKAKANPAGQYEQRDYTDVQSSIEAAQTARILERLKGEGA